MVEPFVLDMAAEVPLYRQLYDRLREAVGSGGLRVGEKLPSIRRMAEELGVSRTTVEQAYQQLCVEGYLVSRPQSGYFVEAGPTDPREGGKPSAAAYTTEGTAGEAQEVRYDFGSRYVESRRADTELWRKYVRAALSDEAAVSSYGHYQGEPTLREELARYGRQLRGVRAEPDSIVVGAGVQPLLSLLCGLLEERAGRVGMESPCFPQAERVFRDFRLPITALGHDASGVKPQELYAAKIDVLYLNPSYTESMGRPMPVSRRAALLEWAAHTHGLIVEDDYNGALRFNSRPVPALQGMDDGGRVVYLGSFSKLLMPSVRLSYMVLPPDLAARYRERGKYYNQTSSKVEQLALAAYLRDGQMEKRLRRLRKSYAEKSALLMAALTDAFGKTAEISLVETALCVEMAVAGEASAEDLAARALAMGVRVMPMGGGSGKAVLRLSFAGIAEQDIAAGAACLRQAIGNR